MLPTRLQTVLLTAALAMPASLACADTVDTPTLQAQVMAAERAFAKTMADRNFVAFAGYVSEEAVFFTGPKPLHGRQAVVDAWKRFYEPAKAPFSWEPDTAEVLPSGTLALTSGPVRDPAGKLVGRFNSVWRLEPPGTWRVVFDKGEDICDCKGQGKP